ncbi:hypothetical protein GCM10009775_07080 [Microbacterium aoyamense]|uniref:HTH arsR-type domain-containing protein n=2 Tax=Microbacterium aoyamense TaxID=344166 RepID=A0ABP5AS60_9MICO
MDAARLFSALANSERLAIVDALVKRSPRTCGPTISEIAGATDLSRFSASRHLAILRSAGLVTAERVRGGFRHRINVDGLTAIEDWAYARSSTVPTADESTYAVQRASAGNNLRQSSLRCNG